MITVIATREGLVGQMTASGIKITREFPGVALPSVRALLRFVRVQNTANGKIAIGLVYDVGPWNTEDDPYVFQPGTQRDSGLGWAATNGSVRPASERGESVSGKGTNGAGIDLSEAVWNALGMTDNGLVQWEFLE